MTEVIDYLLNELPEDTPPYFCEIIEATTKLIPKERERFPEVITRVSNLLSLPTATDYINYNFEPPKTHYEHVKEVFEKNPYYSERMLPDEEAKLFEEYTAAVNGNHQYAESCFHLARCYYDGKGTKQDYTKAFEFFLNAARGGVTQAQYMVGKAYEYGEGTDKNIAEASEWYSKAREGGHPETLNALKRMMD